ncbi:MAG: hypothetical protein WKF73_07835 [Nocardioidaceae bacterium]
MREHVRPAHRAHVSDWYGQDGRGRVWYLGENSHAYDHGGVSTEGSLG